MHCDYALYSLSSLSILVNIYGSQEMFVSEYRHLLADRLIQALTYDISREVCLFCFSVVFLFDALLFQLRNLELLKLRFGESSLHFCDVMLKDIADSRRSNTHIHARQNEVQVSLHFNFNYSSLCVFMFHRWLK